MNSWRHAVSSARKWGGSPDDYIDIHELIDGSKRSIGDARHRALLHHTEGVWLCQMIFGRTIRVGRHDIPVREIAERHIREDLGALPSFADYLRGMPLRPWMTGVKSRTLSLTELGLNGEHHDRHQVPRPGGRGGDHLP